MSRLHHFTYNRCS